MKCGPMFLTTAALATLTCFPASAQNTEDCRGKTDLPLISGDWQDDQTGKEVDIKFTARHETNVPWNPGALNSVGVPIHVALVIRLNRPDLQFGPIPIAAWEAITMVGSNWLRSDASKARPADQIRTMKTGLLFELTT